MKIIHSKINFEMKIRRNQSKIKSKNENQTKNSRFLKIYFYLFTENWLRQNSAEESYVNFFVSKQEAKFKKRFLETNSIFLQKMVSLL